MPVITVANTCKCMNFYLRFNNQGNKIGPICLSVCKHAHSSKLGAHELGGGGLLVLRTQNLVLGSEHNVIQAKGLKNAKRGRRVTAWEFSFLIDPLRFFLSFFLSFFQKNEHDIIENIYI